MTGSTEHTAIAMPDGIRLAATLYRPATDQPVPCLLEALPYRKDDLTAGYRPEYARFRDEFGYAVARVDLRGSGSSGGIALDEYHPQEQADLHAVIEWLAAQPWCTGAVGMFGTSWSGFNSLQMACANPPALRAVIASHASDDRWSDDVHYMGGALRLLDLVDYPLYMVAMNALPPVPALFGDGWHDEWTRRAQDTPPWLLRWLHEQADGAYWRHGSVRPGYDRIRTPTMLITGWADGYRNVGFRTLAALMASGTPARVLAGPWSHAAPATSVPGPNVDHVPLMARWWDRWLRDAPVAPDGDEKDPPLTVFVRGYAPPDPAAANWAGRWEAHDEASLASVRDVELPLAAARVSGAEVAAGLAVYEPALDVGLTAWNSCAAALPWGQPQDQTPDDARSLCLSWAAHERTADGPAGDVLAGATVLGHPRLRLRVRPDHASAFVSAKLSLVPPSGRPSLLVDRGLLNLAYAHGDSTDPRPCVPGEWLDVDVELEATAFEITAGCTLRLALACADWPNTIAPAGTWSAIDLAGSTLVLPISPGPAFPAPDLPTPAVEFAALPSVEVDNDDQDDDSWVTWRHGSDVLARTTWAEVDHGSAFSGALPERSERFSCTEHYNGRVSIDRLGPGDAVAGEQRVRASARYDVSWPEVDATSHATLDVTADADTLDVRLRLDVRDGDEAVATRTWHERIPRRWT
jgi:putative CocE/NonD family hydrolase